MVRWSGGPSWEGPGGPGHKGRSGGPGHEGGHKGRSGGGLVMRSDGPGGPGHKGRSGGGALVIGKVRGALVIRRSGGPGHGDGPGS